MLEFVSYEIVYGIIKNTVILTQCFLFHMKLSVETDDCDESVACFGWNKFVIKFVFLFC